MPERKLDSEVCQPRAAGNVRGVLIHKIDRSACTSESGRISVCNTVERARQAFEALGKLGATADLRLIHSRFRQAEREHWRNEFLSKAACTPETDRIIVATRVVEGGVDISAVALITELGPWPSLVQRFGPCARFGGQGRVTVVDRALKERKAAPYAVEDLERAREALANLDDVGIGRLEEHEARLSRRACETVPVMRGA